MSKPKKVDLVDSQDIVVRHPLSLHHSPLELDSTVVTEQSHKEVVCINRIMRNVERHGVIPVDPRGRVPNYGDVSHLNQPLDQLITQSRDTKDRLVKLNREQREKLRLAKLEKRKKDEQDLAAYRASLAAVDKTSSTESQST